MVNVIKLGQPNGFQLTNWPHMLTNPIECINLAFDIAFWGMFLCPLGTSID